MSDSTRLRAVTPTEQHPAESATRAPGGVWWPTWDDSDPIPFTLLTNIESDDLTPQQAIRFRLEELRADVYEVSFIVDELEREIIEANKQDEVPVPGLSDQALERIVSSGLTVRQYVEHWQNGDSERWHGDSCGCHDDRCIGHHHGSEDDCGCIDPCIEIAKGYPSTPDRTVQEFLSDTDEEELNAQLDQIESRLDSLSLLIDTLTKLLVGDAA